MCAWRSFLRIWAGQVVSILGSNLSGFALGVWLYRVTGSSSYFALTALCTVLPQLLVSPLVGGLIDRYPRRLMMALGDSGAALCTLVLAALFFSGQIRPWQIFLMTALSAACGALQAPAYIALAAAMTPGAQLGRANGLLQLGQGLAEILAPSIAGALVATIGVAGVLGVDLATFLAAISVLGLVKVPIDSGRLIAAKKPSGITAWLHDMSASFQCDLKEGWAAVSGCPGLPGLLRFQMLFSFLWSLFAVLVAPMILGFSDAPGLGLALTVAGAGMLAGSLVMSAWGGPRCRLDGILAFELASAVAFVLMGLRPNLWLVAAAAFLAHFTLAFVAGLNQAVWQSSVSSTLLGRVLALRQAAMKAATLLAYALAGGLADRILEPLLRSGGGLSALLGPWIGIGAGRGIAALFILIGLVKSLAVCGVYFASGARRLDALAPV